MRGVSGLGRYQYLLQLKQPQGSIRNGNPSAPQSASQQPQGAKPTTQADPVALLRGLFRNKGRTSSSADTDDDHSVGDDGVKGALSGHHHHNHDDPQASTRATSSMSDDDAYAESGTNGGGSMAQSGMNSRGGSTAGQTTGASGITSYRQRAINRYLQLSSSGSVGAGLNTVVVTT